MMPSPRGLRAGWTEAVALCHLILVLIALLITLRSLATQDFDGLNNMLQLPLSFPWWIPRGNISYVQSAFMDAGFGVLNSVLLYRWLSRRRRRRDQEQLLGHLVLDHQVSLENAKERSLEELTEIHLAAHPDH